MFSMFNFDASNISSTTIGLISFTTLYLIYKCYLFQMESDIKNKLCNELNKMMQEIEKDPYDASSKLHIHTKILNNKIKMFTYSQLNKLLE